MKFAAIDVALLDLEILRHQVSELPESFSGHRRLGVFEVYNFLDEGKASPEVDVVEQV